MTSSPLIPWLYFVFFYSTLFNHVVVVSSGGHCLSDQQSLLLQLKDTLIFNATTSKVLVRWNQSSDCCTWEGVSCEQGRVTGLKLSNESISGGINDNSTLFNLQYLQSLDLSWNNISSTIPSRIGNLINLSYLNFSSAFSGQIPNEISHLKKLLILDLSVRSYLDFVYYDFGFWMRWDCEKQLGSPDLKMLVQNLTELEELYLGDVNISAAGNEWGPALSSSLPNLRVLSLVACGLSGPIHQSLANLRYLSVVQLDYNYLNSPVPKFFGNFSNLTSLKLRGCELYGTFPKEIFRAPTLRILDISKNELLEGSLPEFPPNSALQFLDISITNFSGRLPSSIGNLRQLTHLYLYNCLFSGPLPKSIAKLTQLVRLDLSNNQFVGPIPSFDMTKNLERIHLSYNHLSGPISSAHLEGLLNLLFIYLSDNSFNGIIPSSLFTLPLLEIIDLSHNQFSGQVLEFPNASSSMLETIDLSSNKLQGPIPMSIFNLKALKFLYLSSNKFTGTIQLDTIEGRTNLWSLDLSYNKFNGTIQLHMIEGLSNLWSLDLSYNNISINGSTGNGSIFSFAPRIQDLGLASCNLRKFPYLSNQLGLSHLDLSDNQIYGEIPNWIWNVGSSYGYFLNLSNNHLMSIEEPYNISYLTGLDLSFNQLHGKIPILPPNISLVDLSNNNFTSSIPSDIGKKLHHTTYFSLSNNNALTGIIPESICEASNLQVLDLSNNNFNGRIPTCVLATSWVVNLGKNNLSGPIPDLFPVDCSLKTLDLNGNSLTKSIPKSLANCRELEYLDLGNNQMLDTFPRFLKNISSLSVLILQSNKFYGQITCTESIGDWPMVQIVDIASNNFSGELPGKCLTKWHTMMTDKGYGQSQLHHPITTYPYSPPTSQYINYEDAVSITNKGLEMEMLKIVSNRFTYIDFSSNKFHGEIPKELGQLICLHGLNLSNNVLSGHIPSSFGNMRQLESLDLSRNQLSGKIPASLSNLDFLGFLNLSYNQLHGRIPTGNHIQTFSAGRFEGNKGLCGPPLTPNCPGDVLPETPKANHSISGNNEIEWNLISAEIGFIVGFGTVIGPLVFWKKWRKWYFDRVEDIAFSILPQKLLRKWLSWKMGIRRRVRVNGQRAT